MKNLNQKKQKYREIPADNVFTDQVISAKIGGYTGGLLYGLILETIIHGILSGTEFLVVYKP